MPVEETGSDLAGITSCALFSRLFENVLSLQNRIKLTRHVLLKSGLKKPKIIHSMKPQFLSKWNELFTINFSGVIK